VLSLLPDGVDGAMIRFRDRADAGHQLGERLQVAQLTDPVVLALPRGGVPVASEVAKILNVPFEVFVARKIGAPGHPEYGIGAIAEGDSVIADEHALHALAISQEQFNALVAIERTELQRRVELYRRGRDLPPLADHDVIVVDDGLATGVTAEAALHTLRAGEPHRLLLAVPACAPDTAHRLRGIADDVVCVIASAEFSAVGYWYTNFDQTSDDDVLNLLQQGTNQATTNPMTTGDKPSP